MASLRVEESRKLMSPNSDLSFDELESTHPKPSSTRSSGSDFSFGMPKANASKPRSSWTWKTLSTRQLRSVCSIAIIIVVAVFVYLVWSPRHVEPVRWSVANEKGSHTGGVTAPPATTKELTKPKDFKIVGLLFYGRPRFVHILDCYLKNNLVSNGGFLDEVIFMINTKREDDVAWLDELIATEPLYSKKETEMKGGHFDNIWNRYATDENTMYIKIDDDIIFVHDDTIPRMVYTLMAHPEAHDVAANIINSPLTHWLHYHTEAVFPYLPEETNDTIPDPTSWRASDLPKYNGTHNTTWTFPGKPEGQKFFKVGDDGGPRSDNHRWLPMERNSKNLMTTPIAAGKDYNPFGKGWFEWTMAAQQHYSLLENMENEDFGRYWAGNQDGIWNMQYTRYNLNFLAIWGSSVKMMGIGGDDEDALTVAIPLALKRPCIIDTHAVVSHFSFGPTPELEKTDLLERYRLYANEKVCSRDNQKPKLDAKWLEWHSNTW